MKKLSLFFSTHKHSLSIAAAVLFVVAIFVSWPSAARADLGSEVNQLLGNIFSGLVWIIGKILIVLINLVIWVAQYNGFLASPAIQTGWTILRDVCNMFFILILLVIAFATTLNIESYGMKKLLRDFIIAAVLINFSKLICGVIIDFAQVIMLTFVNGFRDIGGGNLADMLGITGLLSKSSGACQASVSTISVLGTYVLAFIYVIVATVVILAILFSLIMRIVMIWIYVTLSPLAFLLSVLPATKSYAGTWWKQFAEAVASGPILAFFIWLAFATATIGSKGQDIINVEQGSAGAAEEGYTNALNDPQAACAGLADAGSPDGMLKFIISIGLLMGGLIITKQAGGMVGGIAGSALGKLEGMGKKLPKLGWNATKGTAKLAGKTALMTAKAGGRTALKYGGKGLEAVGNATDSKLLQGAGKFATGWHADIKKDRDDAKAKKKQKILEKLGIKEKGQGSLKDWGKKSMIGKMTGDLLAGSPGAAMMTPIAKFVNYAGGVIKDAAYDSAHKTKLDQANKNYNDSEKVVNNLESKVSKPYKQYQEELRGYDDKEKEDLASVIHDRNQSMEEQEALGTPEKEIKEIDKGYQDQIKQINDRYKAMREHAESEYNKKVSPEEKEKDSLSGPAYQQAVEYHKKAKETKDWADHVAQYGDKGKHVWNENFRHKKEMEELQKQRVDEAKSTWEKFKDQSPAVAQSEVNLVHDKYNRKVQAEEEMHKKNTDQINSTYKQGDRENLQLGLAGKIKHWGGDVLESYNPSRIVELAIKKGLEASTNAKKTMQAMGQESIGSFKKGSWSSANGLSDEQKKVFEHLSAATDASKEAIAGFTKEIKRMRNLPSLSKPEKANIEEFKRGLAHYLKEKPGDVYLYKTIISDLDEIDTGDKRGRKKVEDFAPKTD